MCICRCWLLNQSEDSNHWIHTQVKKRRLWRRKQAQRLVNLTWSSLPQYSGYWSNFTPQSISLEIENKCRTTENNIRKEEFLDRSSDSIIFIIIMTTLKPSILHDVSISEKTQLTLYIQTHTSHVHLICSHMKLDSVWEAHDHCSQMFWNLFVLTSRKTTMRPTVSEPWNRSRSPENSNTLTCLPVDMRRSVCCRKPPHHMMPVCLTAAVCGSFLPTQPWHHQGRGYSPTDPDIPVNSTQFISWATQISTHCYL